MSTHARGAAAARTGRSLTLGVDEAGRGPAIGPMVLAAVALDARAAAALTRKGLRDSKAFGAGDQAHAVRRALADQIRERAAFCELIEVSHAEIDRRVVKGELNLLEREVAARLIEAAPPVGAIIADGKRLFAPLAARFAHLESLDRAEDHHPAVAAASVIAKVRRDECWAAIRQRYEPELGPISGGGYANAATRAWVRAYVQRHGRLPDEARRSWPHPYVADLLEDVRSPAGQIDLFP